MGVEFPYLWALNLAEFNLQVSLICWGNIMIVPEQNLKELKAKCRPFFTVLSLSIERTACGPHRFRSALRAKMCRFVLIINRFFSLFFLALHRSSIDPSPHCYGSQRRGRELARCKGKYKVFKNADGDLWKGWLIVET